MSYLVVKTASNATPESYQLTDAINAPRLAVSGSYVPITAGGGSAGNINIADGNSTYRVMRTSTTSSTRSASATFLTSGIDSAGMSNTTALTRASTSSTVYGTKAGTITHVQVTSLRSEHYGEEYRKSTISYTVSATSSYVNWVNNTRWSYTYSGSGSHYAIFLTYSSAYTMFSTMHTETASYNKAFAFVKAGQAYSVTLNTNIPSQTTATSYLTRSSISGYTGVSSSSSSESESATCWA